MTTPNPPTPAEVAAQLRRVFEISNGFEIFLGLFAEDGVFELPFDPPDRPTRFVGRQAIRDGLTARVRSSRARLDTRGAEIVVHETTDPEVVVVEFEAYGSVKETGEDYRFSSSIGIIRVRDGRIVHYRDFQNPRVISVD
ncbi:nuclear transport factor 2 family protein [Fodinicola acaciae]|uniref:nuclear transport factor 2 family protein n=1 Tax=Fodinicola acaciae TaxID=2681555 RepID=UPI0013CF8363|nr:nuclear transport factor 2 family protein [Fodinicola acaciae]